MMMMIKKMIMILMISTVMVILYLVHSNQQWPTQGCSTISPQECLSPTLQPDEDVDDDDDDDDDNDDDDDDDLSGWWQLQPEPWI